MWNCGLPEFNKPVKDAEYYALRFANYCGEMEVFTPTHFDYQRFIEQGADYYDKHVENAEKKLKNE